MTAITFTPEKQSLISDFLKTHCGGRKWHQVKAKKQEQAEAHADDIIAKNAAIIAEREAAEVLRQQRLAMPAQRHYDGANLNAVIIKNTTPLSVYKSIFRVYDDADDNAIVMAANFTKVCGTLAMGLAHISAKRIERDCISRDECATLSLKAQDEFIELFTDALNKKESLDNDIYIASKIQRIYASLEHNAVNYETAHFVKPYIKKTLKCTDKFKKIVMWVIKNTKQLESQTADDFTAKFMEEVGMNYINAILAKQTFMAV